MNIKRFLFSTVCVLALIPIYQNCAKKASSFSEDTSKAAMLDTHLSGGGYEIVHDSGDGYGEVTPEQLYTNIEGGDSSTSQDDPVSPEGNSVEPNMPDSNPNAPSTDDQNADGSPVVPLDCDKPDNLAKECVENPVEIPEPPPVTNSPTVNATFDVERWCRGRKDKGNVMDSKFISILIKSVDGKTLCEGSGENLVDEIIASSTMTLKNCDLSKLPNDAVIYVYNNKDLSLYHADDKKSYALFSGNKDAVHSENTKAKAVKVKVGDYKKHQFLPILLADNHKRTSSNRIKACDKYDGSPLVIDMRAYSILNTAFDLIAPEQGKLFNILGDNEDPQNTKRRISWVTDSRIMFIALPNSSGQVNGINELFGDNTRGPDGFFADNGFKALAKYDAYNFSSKKVNTSARNGMIEKSDEVFGKLRLWYDKDLDAEVDAGELITLNDAGVKSIDLGYNTKFHVRDQNGNHIKFKSAVEMTDGKLRPVFDIWFKLDESLN